MRLAERVVAAAQPPAGRLLGDGARHPLGRVEHAVLAPLRARLGARTCRVSGTRALEIGVDPAQVSRAERNDYRGVTADRARRVMEALGVRFTAEAESLLVADDAEVA